MFCIVIGGSNGLGLSISSKLIRKGYKVLIYDIIEPKINFGGFLFKKIDLSKDDIAIMTDDISSADMVIYTAGIGRVDKFNKYSFNDIDKTIDIDLKSLVKVITLSSNNLLTKNNFKCCCISSIAGLVVSPLFSVYSAAKAGVCKYIEAVNTELEKNGSNNRITNVVATSFQGTSFNGGNTDLTSLSTISDLILDSMMKSEELCMINKELIGSIIARYQEDSKKFALESYEYKISKGRIK